MKLSTIGFNFIITQFYASSNAYLRLYVNGDSTAANYVSGGIRCATGLAAAVVDGQYEINGYSEKNAANNSLYTVTIPSYANTIIKTLNCSGNQFQANSSTVASYSHTIVYNSTTAISSITFAPSAGTMSAGTVRIYGVR